MMSGSSVFSARRRYCVAYPPVVRAEADPEKLNLIVGIASKLAEVNNALFGKLALEARQRRGLASADRKDRMDWHPILLTVLP